MVGPSGPQRVVPPCRPSFPNGPGQDDAWLQILGKAAQVEIEDKR